MAKPEIKRHRNGQFAPSLLGKNAPTPSASLPTAEKVPLNAFGTDSDAYYWSTYQAQKRRKALVEEYPQWFPEGGSWYEDSSDDDTLVYLYVSPGNTQPLRWVQVDRLDSAAYRVLEMTEQGTPQEILSVGIAATGSDAQ